VTQKPAIERDDVMARSCIEERPVDCIYEG
jgi:hypothetical protein